MREAIRRFAAKPAVGTASLVVVMAIGAGGFVVQRELVRPDPPARTKTPIVSALPGPSSIPQVHLGATPGKAVVPSPQELAAAEKKASDLAHKVRTVSVPTTFKVATFNVLGSNHTRPGADAARRFAPGGPRTRWAAAAIKARGFSIIGFSEMQVDQFREMTAALGWDSYPQESLGFRGVPTNIFWDPQVWSAMSGGTVDIPFVGQTRSMPFVKLVNKTSGRQIWVMNVHNAPNGRQKERDVDMARELRVVKALEATGLPVVLTGDFNEKATAFCKVVGATSLQSFIPGSPSTNGCHPPPTSLMRLDWIFASRSSLSGGTLEYSPEIRRISDHHLGYVTLTLS